MNNSLKCILEMVNIPFNEIEYRCVKNPREHPARKGADFRKGRWASTPSPAEIVENYSPPKYCCVNCYQPIWPHCPKCGYRFLPMGALNLLGIVGTTFAGKSTYLGAMYSTLLSPYSDWYNWGVEIAQDKAEADFKQWIYEPYLSGEPLKFTDPAAPPMLVPIRIRPNGGGWLRSQTEILFHDKAGRTFEQFEDLVAEMPFLREAKGILFLLDPYSIPNLRKELPPENYVLGSQIAEDSKRDPGTVRLNVTNLFSGFERRPKKVDKAFAVVLSKADVLWDDGRELFVSVEDIKLLCQRNRHANGIDQAALNNISEICGNFLSSDSVGMKNFVNNVQATFRDVGFFMVQSWKQRQNRIHEWAIAVEDPLFWLLSKVGG